MMSELDTLKQQLPDRYKVEKTLGQGGMGIVFKARDNVLDKPVAIKMLKTTTAGAQAVRFHSEARTLAKLSHPNLLTALDFQITEEGTPYLVLDFLEGVDLDTFVKREGMLPLNQALLLFKQISDGLKFAHDHDVIHRDIKPSNIMLILDDNKHLQPKIVDFGLSKILIEDQNVTTTGAIIGSPLYMSPEQARGEEVEKASDIYSLGCLFFYVLTGTVPIEGESYLSTISKKISEKAPLLNQVSLETEFPEQLEKLVENMLTISPAKRIKSLDMVLAELENIIDDLSKINVEVEPIKYSGSDKVQFGFRKRTYVISAIGLVALISAAVASSYVMFNRSEKNTKKYTIKQDLLLPERLTLAAGKKYKKLTKRDSGREVKVKSEGDITDDDLKEYENLENISSIDLSDSKVTGYGLRHLDGANVVSMDLSNTPVNNKGLETLKKYKQIKKLSLQRCQNFDAEGVKHLLDCNSIQTLKLQGTPVNDKIIEHISNMKNLVQLDIRMCENLSVKHLETLSRNPSIQKLYIGGRDLGKGHLAAIGKFKGLIALYLDGMNEKTLEEGLPVLANLKHLWFIAFERIDKFPANFSTCLSNVKPLRQLWLKKSIGIDKQLTYSLGKIKQLLILNFIEIDFTEKMDCIYGLSDMNFLKELSIDISAKTALEAIRGKLKNTTIKYSRS